MRDRHGLSGEKVILCVSRLVARKGQDTLIRAMPLVLQSVPEAVLMIVGQGPDDARLRRLARKQAGGRVIFAGGRDHSVTAQYYAAADVFAMPCRTRRAGWVEQQWSWDASAQLLQRLLAPGYDPDADTGPEPARSQRPAS